MKAFGALSTAATASKAIDTKTKEFMALAIGIAVHCDGCVAYHTKMAHQRFCLGKVVRDVSCRFVKPTDLPIVQPNSFRAGDQPRTAKTLGLTIPETLRATADPVRRREFIAWSTAAWLPMAHAEQGGASLPTWIVAQTAVATTAVQQQTQTIPIAIAGVGDAPSNDLVKNTVSLSSPSRPLCSVDEVIE